MPKAKAAKRAQETAPTPPAAQGRDIPADLMVPTNPGEWPPQLDHDVARRLFEMVEDGLTVKAACEALQAEGIDLQRNTVAQWKRRHVEFAKRLDECIDIGIEAHHDECIEIADEAHDRDSAAAAKERRAGREEYRKLKRPERYNPAHKILPGAEGGLLGVVLVPMKVAQPQVEQRPPIEGTAIRVPMKDAS